jgi:hypothetical protein
VGGGRPGDQPARAPEHPPAAGPESGREREGGGSQGSSSSLPPASSASPAGLPGPGSPHTAFSPSSRPSVIWRGRPASTSCRAGPIVRVPSVLPLRPRNVAGRALPPWWSVAAGIGIHDDHSALPGPARGGSSAQTARFPWVCAWPSFGQPVAFRTSVRYVAIDVRPHERRPLPLRRARLPRPRSPGVRPRWAQVGRVVFALASLAVFVLGFATEVPDATRWGQQSPWGSGRVVSPAALRMSPAGAEEPMLLRGWRPNLDTPTPPLGRPSPGLRKQQACSLS